ncbi:Alpha-L-arabinofuranosidase [Georgenia satyanarayanai]|uniref:non-reducing end alpha-L-arabinofuranosidase n=1 Tax=Georgenia satyanarayanai TaxID=860221 RepID=A0A2Y9C6J0_9MICO|nr:alpha-L-arabinofuranosidase C-terminal domain-containing protein [Georgenia satyanarayanai]PYF99301.1 alpha-L-arabinofuranosidase [Georgenia satyanarayanai]SSA43113.1 Alpha-L-arabinofuranosidase [Georgenia satyanarayanai]
MIVSRRRTVAPPALASLTALTLTAALLAGAPASAAAPPDVLPEDAWLEEFDAEALDERWTVHGESADDWSLGDGALTIASLPGDTYQSDNNAQNVFTVDVPVGDFTAVTSFDAPAVQDFQGAGLIALADMDNYVRAGLAHVGFAEGGPVVVETDVEVAGAFSASFAPRPGSTGETLRMQRSGDVVTTSYWQDGAWVEAGEVTVPFDITQVGLYALAPGGAPSHDAVFDYFAISPATVPEPEEPTDPEEPAEPEEPTEPEERASLHIDGDGTDIEMSPDLYGLFYEDINYAADGGLYAELVRNRSFEFNAVDNASYTGLTGWQVVQPAGGSAAAEVVSDEERLNDANRFYLRLDATAAGAAIRNEGFSAPGLALEEGTEYEFSVWARTATAQDLSVRLEDAAGAEVHGTATVAVDGSDEWTRYEVTLTSDTTTDAGRLTVETGAAGVLHLDMVSLMPGDTWEGPVNGQYGLRADLTQKLADLDPSFLRFPGGCLIAGSYDTYEGSGYEDRARIYHWKETIGPLEERATNKNWWGYNQTYGIGYLEYLMLAEDLGALPLPVVSVGTNACGGPAATQDPEVLDTLIDDTLDLIEFATGDVDTEWGAVRAGLGHPEPFDLQYIGLGNEDSQREYFENYPLFHDAIREAYPEISIVSNSSFASGGDLFDELWDFAAEQGADMVDEHYYNDADWFLANTDRYDSYDREGPDVFIGEYASRGNRFANALAEAAYLTGIERNSDIVKMASYAPLFANDQHVQWADANLIYFDNDESWGTANYWVQHLFSNNRGHEVVPSALEGGEVEVPDASGGVFLSTWATSAAYDDLVVTGEDGEVLLAEDFSAGAEDWAPVAGTWEVVDGQYRQTSTSVEDARTVPAGAYDEDWTNYTVELTATKLDGNEGFLVGFAAGGPEDFYWWNIGGWNNTRSVLERANGARQGEVAARENVSLTTGEEYDVRIEVEGTTIRLYLDDELHLEYTEPAPSSTLHHVVTRDTDRGDLVVKVVNSADTAAVTDITVSDAEVDPTARVTEIVADPAAVNTKADPGAVVPVDREITTAGEEFTYEFPAHSVTFLRLAVDGADPDPEPTDPEPTDPGPTDPEPTDPGPTEEPTTPTDPPAGGPDDSSGPGSGRLPATGAGLAGPLALVALALLGAGLALRARRGAGLEG